MYLEPKETVIVNGMLGSNNRVFLTNKRLVFEETQGRLLRMWKPYHQLSLSDIEETYVEESFIMDTIKIKLKNGPVMRVQFSLTDTETLDNGEETDSLSGGIAERWVQIINAQLSKCTRKGRRKSIRALME
jgi:hypothetical protein